MSSSLGYLNDKPRESDKKMTVKEHITESWHFFERDKSAVPTDKPYEKWGVVLWFANLLLYWGRNIDRESILAAKIIRVAKNTVNGLLVFLGLLGILSWGWVFYDLTQAHRSLWLFLTVKDWRMSFFWLTVVLDMYVVYRLQHDMTAKITVQKKIYLKELPVLSVPDDWTSVKSIEKKYWVDVSKAFDDDALKSMEQSWLNAETLGHREVRPIHLLAALLESKEIGGLFSRLGVTAEALHHHIRVVLGRQAIKTHQATSLWSPAMKQLPFLAYAKAMEDRQETVRPAQLLISLVELHEEVGEMLYDLKIDLDQIKNVVAWLNMRHQLQERYARSRWAAGLRPKHGMDRAMTAQATPLLNRFSEDLTQAIQRGYAPLTVGRDKEIEEIFRLLESGARGVILVGEPGVGKTAIIEGIAERIIDGDVPEILREKRLLKLNLTALVSAAAAQGDVINVFNHLMNELVRAGNVMLFIDHLDELTGLVGSGGLNLADAFAETLSAGRLVVLAATTTGAYREKIEGHAVLDNALSVVRVREMAKNEAIVVLESKLGVVEFKNKVYFSYAALERAVELSLNYLPDKFLPEKAIRVIEETATVVRRTKGNDATVEAEDVAQVIATKTNVPVTKLTESETAKLVNLEDEIHRRVIGQEQAVKMVADALRRARTALRDLNRPIVNLLFLGPTGVGKTELAKAVAEAYFGAEEKMIRLDMSEYRDAGSINKLIGAPPGYSGGEAGGQLTEAVRREPHSLVLLDELEKAHPDILNVFLQVMEDGRLTDSTGRTVSFKNVILIATSNAGTTFIQEANQKNTPPDVIQKEMTDHVLKPYFQPEFLNRFDGIVIFQPLTAKEILQIAKLMLVKVQKRLAEKGIAFRVEEAAIEELAAAGFDPVFGARPLRRQIQEVVDNALSKYLLAGKLTRRDVAVLKTGGVIEVEKAESYD